MELGRSLMMMLRPTRAREISAIKVYAARDFERYAKTVAAFVRLTIIRIMLRRLTRPSLCS